MTPTPATLAPLATLLRCLTPAAAVLFAIACLPDDPPPPPIATTAAPQTPQPPGALAPDHPALTFTRAIPLNPNPPATRTLPPEAEPAQIGVSILPTLAALCGIPTVHIYFDTADEAIDPPDHIELKRVATCLTTPPLDDVRIAIIGHTDPTGDPDFNAALSRRRAQAVADAIKQAGIAPTRIELTFQTDPPTQQPPRQPPTHLMRRVDVRVLETDPVAIQTGWYDLDADRRVDIAEFPSYIATLVNHESWDPDADGTITPAELARALFTVWDIDATGVLDHVEFTQATQRWYATDATQPHYFEFDRDEDGVLTPGEFVAAAIMHRLDARWDLDDDDRLDPAELAAALGALWDLDGDGELARDELATFAAAYWRR